MIQTNSEKTFYAVCRMEVGARMSAEEVGTVYGSSQDYSCEHE